MIMIVILNLMTSMISLAVSITAIKKTVRRLFG